MLVAVIWANSAVVVSSVAPLSFFAVKIASIWLSSGSVWAMAIFNASVKFLLEAETNSFSDSIGEIVLLFTILLILLKAFKDSPLVSNCVVKVVIV